MVAQKPAAHAGTVSIPTTKLRRSKQKIATDGIVLVVEPRRSKFLIVELREIDVVNEVRSAVIAYQLLGIAIELRAAALGNRL
jgi:hypothetical protein